MAFYDKRCNSVREHMPFTKKKTIQKDFKVKLLIILYITTEKSSKLEWMAF